MVYWISTSIGNGVQQCKLTYCDYQHFLATSAAFILSFLLVPLLVFAVCIVASTLSSLAVTGTHCATCKAGVSVAAVIDLLVAPFAAIRGAFLAAVGVIAPVGVSVAVPVAVSSITGCFWVNVDDRLVSMPIEIVFRKLTSPQSVPLFGTDTLASVR